MLYEEFLDASKWTVDTRGWEVSKTQNDSNTAANIQNSTATANGNSVNNINKWNGGNSISSSSSASQASSSNTSSSSNIKLDLDSMVKAVNADSAKNNHDNSSKKVALLVFIIIMLMILAVMLGVWATGSY